MRERDRERRNETAKRMNFILLLETHQQDENHLVQDRAPTNMQHDYSASSVLRREPV